MTQIDSQDPDAVEALVAEVVDEFMERVRRGEQPDVEDYACRHAEIAELLRRVLPAMQLFGPQGEVETAYESMRLGQALGDFRIVREVGRGGMGIVYEAEQLSLGRKVALKVLPFAGTLDPRRLQRFKNEAQAAAHLQHQHIVPVYFVGQERGVHYYAMQFVEGRTLAELINEARAARQPAAPANEPPPDALDTDTTAFYAANAVVPTVEAMATVTRANGVSSSLPADQRGYCRAVARLGEQAALALEHAHQMGVIHRDIKPANLMVDDSGHLWITDFGLAQIQSDVQLTLSGDLLGTLRYMSPEQALAQRVLVDQRTDVYSLGVTLYELLTLEPAFGGRDRQEVLRQIAFEEPLSPRKRNKAIPLELETIVLKAMAKAPEERYPTAQELADDLRHWLDDKPIRARRPNLVERMRRAMRRHRGLVRAAVAVSVLAVAASLTSTWLIWREKERTTAALARAEERTHLARLAVDEMYSEVAEQWLADAPHMTNLEKRFLRKAADFYQVLSQERSANPEVRLQAAVAYRRLGAICGALDDSDVGAADYYSQAIAISRGLVHEFPENSAYQAEYFRDLYALGTQCWVQGQLEQAERPLRQASMIVRALAVEKPMDTCYAHELAQCLQVMAEVLWRSNPEEADRNYREAERIQEELVARFPTNVMYQCDLATMRGGRIGFLAAAGKLETRDSCQRVLASLEAALASFRGGDGRRASPPWVLNVTDGDRINLGSAYNLLGSLLMDLGRLEGAQSALDRAVEIREKRSTDYPHRTYLLNGLAFAEWNRARVLVLRGRPADATDALRRAVAHQQKVLHDRPNNPFRRSELAVMLGDLAAQELHGAARSATHRHGLAHVQEALKLTPDAGCYLWALRGLAYYRLGEWDRAIAVLEEATGTLGGPLPQGWKFADCSMLVQSARRNERSAPALVLLLLAMSYQARGQSAQAAHYYQQACRWRARHPSSAHEPPELHQMEVEAAQVLEQSETSGSRHGLQ